LFFWVRVIGERGVDRWTWWHGHRERGYGGGEAVAARMRK